MCPRLSLVTPHWSHFCTHHNITQLTLRNIAGNYWNIKCVEIGCSTQQSLSMPTILSTRCGQPCDGSTWQHLESSRWQTYMYVCERAFSWVGGGKSYTDCGHHRSMAWSPRQDKWGSELSTSIWLALLPHWEHITAVILPPQRAVPLRCEPKQTLYP